MKIATSALLAAGAFGLMLTAASAQDYGSGPGYDAPPPPPPDYGPAPEDNGPPPPPAYAPDNGPPPEAYAPGEQVIVVAPRPFGRYALAPTEMTRLSTNVSYSDLDLRTAAGAVELRQRVRDAAREVCDSLVVRFPHALHSVPSCYRTAADSGINRANTAISFARHVAYNNGDYSNGAYYDGR